MLTIDGSLGEGGGQILRTSLSLSAVLRRPFRLENIRANRKKPGLRPQHLTAVRAVAALTDAELSGDAVDSTTLEFLPTFKPAAGRYRFDVSEEAGKASAGSASLILQTVLWPMLFADGEVSFSIRGGTHVNFSPTFHYLQAVSMVSYRKFGVNALLELLAYGWMPKGDGHVILTTRPVEGLQAADFLPEPVETVQGIALSTQLPSHIPHRMSRRADNRLTGAGFAADIQVKRFKGESEGAGVFLWTDTGRAGGTGLGRKGYPSDKVADDAFNDISDYVNSGSGVDRYLADQLLLPAALAHGVTTIHSAEWTEHAHTNAALLEQWLDCKIEKEGEVWKIHGVGLNLG